MMTVVAVHASSGGCFAALVREGFEPLTIVRPQASTALPGVVLELLDTSSLSLADVSLFAVCRGPGSFTGIKISISCLWGLARATGVPLVGLSSLEVLASAGLDVVALRQPRQQLARAAEGGPIRVLAVLPAYGGMVYASTLDVPSDGVPRMAGEPWAGPPSRLVGTGPAGLTLVVESGATQLLPPGLKGADRITVSPGPHYGARTGTLARILTSRREAHPAEPLYLRADPAKAW